MTFDGEIFRVHNASLEPKSQAPLPILYGGPSRRAARIAACHADGWLAGTVPLTTVDARLAYMRELLGTIEDIRGVVVGDADDVATGVLEYYNRGFDHFTFDVRNQFDRFEETIEEISRSVLPIVRGEIARSNVPQADRRS